MATGKFQVKNCIIDLSEFTITIDGKKAKEPTKSEWAVLSCLIEQNGGVATFSQLQIGVLQAQKNTDGEISEYDISKEPSNIRSYVSKIGHKLGSDAEIIENVRGVGYKLVERPICIEESHFTKEELKQEARVETEEFKKFLDALPRNVHLTRKGRNEGSDYPSFQARMDECTQLTVLNFAATSFFSSKAISDAYKNQDKVKIWFYENMADGTITADIILLNPHCAAAKDAAIYKMKPGKMQKRRDGMELKYSEIISHNIATLLEYRRNHPQAKINLYLTDIALPYGITMNESATTTDGSKDIMKVDLYSPLDENKDSERPSFFLVNSDVETAELYRIFKDAINYVKQRSVLFTKPDCRWIEERTIVHRGRYSKEHREHSVYGYWECMRHGLPIEVDIFRLSDNTLLVGRDDIKLYPKSGANTPITLSLLTLQQLRELSTDNYCCKDKSELPFSLEELMTLEEFLSLINGRVPLLLELKQYASSSAQETENEAYKLVELFLETIRYYSGTYAVHCANPFVLKVLREMDPCIAIGQISWSYKKVSKKVSVPKYFREIHRTFSFVDIVKPDFISYKLSEIPENRKLIKLCKENTIPLLAWAAYNEEQAKLMSQQPMPCTLIAEANPKLYI